MPGRYVNLGRIKIGDCINMQSKYWAGWVHVMVLDRDGNYTVVLTPAGEQFLLDNRAAGIPSCDSNFYRARQRFLDT